MSTSARVFDRVLDSAPCGFLSFTDDGKVCEVNSTLLNMLDYERTHIVGSHIERIFPVGTRIFYQTHWFPMLRLHGRAEEVFLKLLTSKSEHVGVLSYARRDDQDGMYHCVFVPVVERAKFEEELIRAKREAEQSNELLEKQAVELEIQQEILQDQADHLERLRAAADQANHAKSAFLAMMSHELRTPLNAISGYLEILQMEIPGKLNDGQRDILHRLARSSQHLLGLINQVLSLARIESGHVEYQLINARAADVVASVAPLIEPQMAAKQIAFSVDVEPGLTVYADVEKVQQILVNLLGNAVKFTPEGGSVRIRAIRDADAALFQIIDTGIGIPEENLESIFHPFVQVENTRTRKVEGSGLGLAISRDLARGMRGDLLAASVVGEGSTFTLCLPLR